MASLKEVKQRIASVRSTQKITSAMKMVASAKLHKAQAAIGNMLPYQQRLHSILTNFLGDNKDASSPFVKERAVKRVAIVVFSSNTSLCGGFNANVIRRLMRLLDEYKFLDKENILIFPVGKKVEDAVRKAGFKIGGSYQSMANKPSYQEAADLATDLMTRFLKEDIDKVELLYNHFKNTASQTLTRSIYLPIDLRKQVKVSSENLPDYIIEPDSDSLLEELLPKVLRIELYTALLDSNASEHGARTIAMQTATDNADGLLQDLTVMYNKSRQQAITNELLDIIGGSLS
ncbi:MAG: F0F1 ATP synthase subunit gamma [Parabacteroides sp.]